MNRSAFFLILARAACKPPITIVGSVGRGVGVGSGKPSPWMVQMIPRG